MTYQQKPSKVGTVLFRGGLACFLVIGIVWFAAIIHDATATGEGTASMGAVALAFFIGPPGLAAVVLGYFLRRRVPKGSSSEPVDNE